MPYGAAGRACSAACQATIAALSVCLCSTCGRSFSPQAIPLPEWLYEEGIGESRAALVHKGEILEAYVERDGKRARSEEHTSELQSLMRISYAVFCLKKKKNKNTTHIKITNP